MGTYRHRFDLITHDQEQLTQSLAQTITHSPDQHHAIFFYGPTRTSKRGLMLKMVNLLSQHITMKAEED